MANPHSFLPLSHQQFHILLALTGQPRHGYGIILEVAARTDGALRMGTGTLYTAIARLLTLELIAETNPDDRRRFYRLTPLGRSVLRAETSRLDALVRHARDLGIDPVRVRS